MAYSLYDRLLRREIIPSRYNNFRSIYSDRTWVNGLDIVNELGGHSGCVNALSWSKSGRLLASGSDDTNIVIHTYQPDGQTKPFQLTTSIATGHMANIFSVKFMPHSNDNVLVSCAGDSQVRIFDVEYSSRSRGTRSSGNNGESTGTMSSRNRFLREGDTNAKVFRSHSDRVKRIVTESSPHLFLTCSEDGEVRQWDLRQPSSAYPEPRGGTGWLASRHAPDDRVPPPLISYRRFRLDLNTISCSGSQPHYIALGGAHLHCFLHDRRMIGRDFASERGSPGSEASLNSDLHGDAMGQATQCVRRFAPHGQRKMSRASNGHITACKISDANPNELIASWSGDHVYSFDILRSPDAREPTSHPNNIASQGRVASGESQDRKRKRNQASVSEGSASERRRSRSPGAIGDRNDDVALRVRYENGQSEDIALQTSAQSVAASTTRRPALTPSQKRSLAIARSVAKIRRLIFSLDHATAADHEAADEVSTYAPVFLEALENCQSCLSAMDNIIRHWRYPMDDRPEDVAAHKAMRRQRDRTRRFVQAAGTLSRLLLSQATIETPTNSAEMFDEIKTPATEGPFDDNTEIFRYDFLKAILAWLEGGSVRLIEVFSADSGAGRSSYRFPIPQSSNTNGINRYLIRHLLLLAGQHSIPDLEVSRFEHDEQRQLFPSEREAVTAFSHAVELSDATEGEAGASNSPEEGLSSFGTNSYRSSTIRKFWALKVARGLLQTASAGVDFVTVDRSFGGLGLPRQFDTGRNQTDIDPREHDPEPESAEVRSSAPTAPQVLITEDEESEIMSMGYTEEELQRLEAASRLWYTDSADDESGDDEEELDPVQRIQEQVIGLYHPSDDEDEHFDDMLDAMIEEDFGDAGDTEDEEGDGSSASEDEAVAAGFRRNRLLWRSTSDRARLRETVQAELPVNTHTRTYKGHCNVKTVKDVNFYGPNDDYVVSGSDCGRFFIWDRKTMRLLNILEGDEDVVNVVQGHPYEPMLAVSGIDHTVKIFSADRRAQREARVGINISANKNQSESSFSSLGSQIHRRVRATQARRRATEEQETVGLLSEEGNEVDAWRSSTSDPARQRIAARRAAGARGSGDGAWMNEVDTSDEEMVGQTTGLGLHSRSRMDNIYQIISENDLARQGGLRDAYITVGGPAVPLRSVRLSFAVWRALFND